MSDGSEQATLFDAVGEPEPGECAHDDELVVMSVASPRLTPEGSAWYGKHPIWCTGCSDVIARVRPRDLDDWLSENSSAYRVPGRG